MLTGNLNYFQRCFIQNGGPRLPRVSGEFLGKIDTADTTLSQLPQNNMQHWRQSVGRVSLIISHRFRATIDLSGQGKSKMLGYSLPLSTFDRDLCSFALCFPRIDLVENCVDSSDVKTMVHLHDIHKGSVPKYREWSLHVVLL